MRIFAALILSAVLAVADQAADVSGNWSGKVKIELPDGGTQDDTIYLVLKQTDTAITGTAGPSSDQQRPIATGKIEGNKVTLEVPVPNGAFKFAFALDSDRLKGEIVMAAQGQNIKARMDATRVAPPK
jgi:hypothetical protein